MGMFLNDFRKEKVLSICRDLKESNETNLLFWSSIDEKDYQQYDFLALMYESLMHRIIIFPINSEGLLYPNHNMESTIVPEKAFLKRIAPSEQFEEMFKNE